MLIEEEHTFRQCTIRGVKTGFQALLAIDSTVVYAVRLGRSAWRARLAFALIFLVMESGTFAWAKRAKPAAKTASHSTSFTFMRRDGSCVDGAISRIEPKAIAIAPGSAAPVVIERQDLLRVDQAGSPVFSARSSWADVAAIHLLPREYFSLRFRNGWVIQGKPLRIDAEGMTFKVGLWRKKRYRKDQMVSVDYLRVKPESDAFDRFAQESPAMLFFYPEYYDHLAGLEGKVPVRLYDALQPENNQPLQCASHL